MELEELKKSWKALDEQLPRHPIADEKQLAELIERYKNEAGRGLRKLLGLQRFSLWLGCGMAAIFLLVGIVGCLYIEHSTVRQQLISMLVFVLCSLLLACAWDYKTFRWIRGTQVDVMPVAKVSLRMVKLRSWMRFEVLFVTLWCIIFTVFNWWVIDGFDRSLQVQAFYFSLCFVLDAIIIGYFYKKMVYKHLNNIRNNIKELEDVCSE